jgi:hypothetical protein
MRWQVAGYLVADPNAHPNDLKRRFLPPSTAAGHQNIRLEVDVSEAFIKSSWDDQCSQLAEVMLTNLCSLYEAWTRETVALLESGLDEDQLAKDLCFPSKGAGIYPRRPGAGEALRDLGLDGSPLAIDAFASMLRSRSEYRGRELDALLNVYRYFKEARNALAHAGGKPSKDAIRTAWHYRKLTAADCRLREIPTLAEPLARHRRVRVALRGIIGLANVVNLLVTTLDADLASTPGAEGYFLSRWEGHFPKGKPVMLPVRDEIRTARLRYLIGNALMLPRPPASGIPLIDVELRRRRLTFY